MYEQKCREIANYDKNRPNEEEGRKADLAARFKQDFIDFAKDKDQDHY